MRNLSFYFLEHILIWIEKWILSNLNIFHGCVDKKGTTLMVWIGIMNSTPLLTTWLALNEHKRWDNVLMGFLLNLWIIDHFLLTLRKVESYRKEINNKK